MNKYLIKRDLIYDFIVENNLNTSEFCKLCRISPRVLAMLLLNDFDFDIEYFARMCKTINKNMYELLSDDPHTNRFVLQQIKKRFA